MAYSGGDLKPPRLMSCLRPTFRAYLAPAPFIPMRMSTRAVPRPAQWMCCLCASTPPCLDHPTFTTCEPGSKPASSLPCMSVSCVLYTGSLVSGVAASAARCRSAWASRSLRSLARLALARTSSRSRFLSASSARTSAGERPWPKAKSRWFASRGRRRFAFRIALSCLARSTSVCCSGSLKPRFG